MTAPLSIELITRRSRVRIPPPLCAEAPLSRGFFVDESSLAVKRLVLFLALALGSLVLEMAGLALAAALSS